MSGRIGSTRADIGGSLPIFDRLAPVPDAAALAAHIEDHSGPGDIVADLAGRGGWVARAALDRQRRAISIESNPLTRMLAEVVLRPPDVRHLDAAFQGMSASPRGESSLKVSMGDLFATRCATCGRMLVADEFTWTADAPDDPATATVRHYRCTVCRDQRGGSEQRHAPLEPDDVARANATTDLDHARAWARDRFPMVEGAPDLVDELLDIHTPRQLVALTAIMERIEADLRAPQVLAALRLALLHAILPSSRLAGAGGRIATLRVAGGHVRLPPTTQWRERNPWLAFEEGFRTVRGFVQRLEGGALGPLQARLGEDLRALGEGAATAVLAVTSPSAVRALSDGGQGSGPGRSGPPAPRVRLVLGQPPVRPNLERLAAAYHGTAWTLGREAAAMLPIDALADTSLRAPWSWQAVALARSLAAVEPSMARDGRVIQLVDGGPEALAAVAIGGASAGYRVVVARQSDPDDASAGVVELVPPGAALPPGPRTRANVGLPAIPGGTGDPDVVPGRGLFAPPERFDQRPFSAVDAARVVTEATVETLRARGEPARMERLFGEILVGLDRSGQLRRLATGARRPDAPDGGDLLDSGLPSEPGHPGDADDPGDPDRRGTTVRHVGGADDHAAPPAVARRPTAEREPAPDPVERLLALIRDELASPAQTRLTEIEPGRWWLAEEADQAAAAPPLADRVEWAVFSLLSTAGPLSETAFYERIATLFSGHDLPDETLVRACLDSYRSLASTPDHLVTSDDLLRRSQEHTELLAALTNAGHRLGMRVWLAPREQARRHGRGHLGDLLAEREVHAYLGSIGRPVDALSEVDAIWYIRNKVALLFEVEWTAMLGEPLLRRHARIEPDDRLIRFLVIAPERTELVRHKLDRSPLLRSAMERGGWTIIKWDHLRTFLEAETPDLDDLEPLIGLDPVVERGGEQMPLFGG
ncbi:MAG: hypothetical protein ACXW4T_00145 [Candidatus Limnocylindrales bacterium]